MKISLEHIIIAALIVYIIQQQKEKGSEIVTIPEAGISGGKIKEC